MTNIVDHLLRENMHRSAMDELDHMLARSSYSDMTPCEVAAFVTLLRPVYDRARAEVEPAPALRFIREEPKPPDPALNPL